MSENKNKSVNVQLKKDRGYIVQLKSPEGDSIFPVVSREGIYEEDGTKVDYILASEKGVASGVATLGEDSKVPATQLPIVDNLTTNSSTSVLSAAQGKILNDRIKYQTNDPGVGSPLPTGTILLVYE